MKAALAALGTAAIATPASAQMMLEKVIVTAQKREQSLSDVPISVQAVSGELLESQNITDFKEL